METMKSETAVHPKDGRPLVYLETQGAWRAWLAKNHEHLSGAWLVSKRRATGKSFVSYSEAVDEALCYGWVDSKANRLDDERAMRLFTPRKPKST